MKVATIGTYRSWGRGLKNTVSGFVLAWMIVNVVSVLPAQAAPQQFREFVSLSNGTKMWVEAEVADPSRPTRVIFNGLTNSASLSFLSLSRAFLAQNTNVIRFDFAGQAKTLLENLPLSSRSYSYDAQVRDVVEMIPIMRSRLGLIGPLDAMGQSYGGGIILAMLALQPEFSKETFRSVTVFAPYTEILRSQHDQIMTELTWYRIMYPWWTISDEALYQMIFRRTVMSTYWMAEPEIIGPTPWHTYLYLDGVVELATGIRPFRAVDVIAQMPNMPINIVVSATDQYIPSHVIPQFWNALPAEKRGLFIKVYGAEHKMLQTSVPMSAKLEEITSNSVYPAGSKMEAHTITGGIYVEGKRVDEL